MKSPSINQTMEIMNMARNEYPGVCYQCGSNVPSGAGYFERKKGRWLIKCMNCVISNKKQKGKPLSNAQKIKASHNENMLIILDEGEKS